MAQNILPEVTKSIRYNKANRDYDLYVSIEGEEQYIGSAASYPEGEERCREYAFNFYQDNNTPEKAAQIALATDESPVTVERHWNDEEDHPDGPAPGVSAWVDYQSGCVLFGIDENGNTPIDLNICGVEHATTPITIASLAQIYTDLGHLLADERVRAALPAGTPEPPKRPATTMVRVKPLAWNCRFPMALGLNVGVALERNQAKLGITREQMFDCIILIGELIEDMFDLSAGMGVLSAESDTLVDMAYKQGFHEALNAIQNFMDLHDRAPDKAAAMLGKAA